MDKLSLLEKAQLIDVFYFADLLESKGAWRQKESAQRRPQRKGETEFGQSGEQDKLKVCPTTKRRRSVLHLLQAEAARQQYRTEALLSIARAQRGNQYC